jgi:hypothetical protein
MILDPRKIKIGQFIVVDSRTDGNPDKSYIASLYKVIGIVGSVFHARELASNGKIESWVSKLDSRIFRFNKPSQALIDQYLKVGQCGTHTFYGNQIEQQKEKGMSKPVNPMNLRRGDLFTMSRCERADKKGKIFRVRAVARPLVICEQYNEYITNADPFDGVYSFDETTSTFLRLNKTALVPAVRPSKPNILKLVA